MPVFFERWVRKTTPGLTRATVHQVLFGTTLRRWPTDRSVPGDALLGKVAPGAQVVNGPYVCVCSKFRPSGPLTGHCGAC
ncbi:MAG TPA: hypothetical protein VH372_02620 [Actinospica sp.]|nr:hypothetical protein [Actinospica sp.]